MRTGLSIFLLARRSSPTSDLERAHNLGLATASPGDMVSEPMGDLVRFPLERRRAEHSRQTVMDLIASALKSARSHLSSGRVPVYCVGSDVFAQLKNAADRQTWITGPETAHSPPN